jgi:cyclophilin family peptidyl-prolyl cis-trans isomerase
MVQKVIIFFETTAGDFIIELNPEKAPITVKNFLTYVNEGFYNGTVFHRVMPGFMAQGGGFDTSFKQKPTHDTIKIEADNGLKNDRGTVAMARTGIPDSASSQFFTVIGAFSGLSSIIKSPAVVSNLTLGCVSDILFSVENE